MIKTFLIRRLWLIRHRPIATLLFVLLLPLLLHIFIVLGMNNLVVISLNNVPYELWVFPGVIFLFSLSSMFTIIYRDMFGFRIYNQSFNLLTLAPKSKLHLISTILISSIIESIIYACIAMLILSFFIKSNISFSFYIFIPLFTSVFLLLIGNLVISLSVMIERVSSFIYFIIIFFIFMILGTGIMIELDFFPIPISTVLKHNPISMPLSELRNLLFTNNFNWRFIALPLIVSFLWIFINSALIKKKLKQ